MFWIALAAEVARQRRPRLLLAAGEAVDQRQVAAGVGVGLAVAHQLAQDGDAVVGLAGEAEREAEVAVEREVGRVALQPLAVGRLRLGVAAEPVERDAARGDDRDVARALGRGDVEVGERRLRLAGAELGAGELEQHVRVLGLAPVRLVQRLLGAGVLAHAGVAAAEADQRLDGVGVGLEGLPVERLGGLVVAGVGRPLRQPARRGAAAARP